MYPRWISIKGVDVAEVPLYCRLFVTTEGWRVEQHGRVIAAGRISAGAEELGQVDRARRRAESVWRSLAGSPRDTLDGLIKATQARILEAESLSEKALEELALVRRLMNGGLEWEPYGEGGVCMGCPFGVVLLVRPVEGGFRWMGTGMPSFGGVEGSIESAKSASFADYLRLKRSLVDRAREYVDLRTVSCLQEELSRLSAWALAHGVEVS